MKFVTLTFVKAIFLGALLVIGFDAMAQEQKKEPATETAQVQATQAKVNINKADAAQLTTLPRVGPAIAARIIAHREEHGGFKKPEELMNVKGIGPKTFDRLKQLISIE
jgi:competence protein ComEA